MSISQWSEANFDVAMEWAVQLEDVSKKSLVIMSNELIKLFLNYVQALAGSDAEQYKRWPLPNR